MGIVRESFLIFKNWDNAIRKAPDDVQLELYHAIMDYASTGEKPQGLSWQAEMLLESIEIQMENNIARYTASVENGKKGGRPRKNTENEEETQENQNKEEKNLEKPRKTQENQNEPNHNLYVHEYVYEHDYDSQLVKNKNKFENFDLLNACVRVRERTQSEREPFIERFKQFFVYHPNDKFKDAGYELIDTVIEASEQAETEKGLIFKQKRYNKQDFKDVCSNLTINQFENIVNQLVFNEEIKNRPAYILGCVV